MSSCKPNIDKKELVPSETSAEAANGALPSIVLVHGIFGFGKGRLGGSSYFAGAEKKDERVLVPDLGFLTSVYYRARELFYYLKGGWVDYGEEHSKACGHSQFGRLYEQGHYPEWDEDHPIHFVGHSTGAQVVRVLQQMLADKSMVKDNVILKVVIVSITLAWSSWSAYPFMSSVVNPRRKDLALYPVFLLYVYVAFGASNFFSP